MDPVTYAASIKCPSLSHLKGLQGARHLSPWYPVCAPVPLPTSEESLIKQGNQDGIGSSSGS